jgi:hypothetical protein
MSDSHYNDDIRTSLNISIGARVRKNPIVSYARQHPERVREWARDQISRPDLHGYDFSDDPAGVVNWDTPTADFVASNPITSVERVTTQTELHQLLEEVLRQFRHFVQDQRGWSLLWNQDGTEKPEEAAQLLFLGVAQNYLRMFDVELDREVELGRGPVDFKLSSGTAVRALIEVKKGHNGKFWNGLDHQLPIYLQSDDCPAGGFVAVRYRNTRASDERMRELPSRTLAAATATGRDIRHFVVDGRPQRSASR